MATVPKGLDGATAVRWTVRDLTGDGLPDLVVTADLSDRPQAEPGLTQWYVHPNEGSGFEEELQVLGRFRHPNLVILLGFARHRGPDGRHTRGRSNSFVSYYGSPGWRNSGYLLTIYKCSQNQPSM